MRAAWARSCCDRSWGLIGPLGVRLSVTHESDSAACRRFNDFEDAGRKRAQVLDAVAARNQDDDRDVEGGDVLLAHPISGAVLASWPTSSRVRRLGRHSSSRTRTSEEGLLGLLQRGNGLFSGDGRKIVEELR